MNRSDAQTDVTEWVSAAEVSPAGFWVHYNIVILLTYLFV